MKDIDCDILGRINAFSRHTIVRMMYFDLLSMWHVTGDHWLEHVDASFVFVQNKNLRKKMKMIMIIRMIRNNQMKT